MCFGRMACRALVVGVDVQHNLVCNSQYGVSEIQKYVTSHWQPATWLHMLLAVLTRTGFKPISALTKRSFSSAMSTPFLLSPSQLQASLQQRSGDSNQLTILDSSWFMPNSPRRPSEEFQKKRIPGAQFLDLDEVASPHELGLKHMIPSGRQFADACGIDNLLN